VYFRALPAEGALVTFVPAEPHAPRPAATVSKDGGFQLTTRTAFDGAAPGHYAVTIVYPSPEKKVDDQNAGPDLLRGRFADPKTTPLSADITVGENDLTPYRLR
jgi:hypothetical protein